MSRDRRILAALGVALVALLVAVSAWLSQSGIVKPDVPTDDVVYPRDLPDGPDRGAPDEPGDRESAQTEEPIAAPALPAKLPKLHAKAGTPVGRAVGAPGRGFVIFNVGAIGHSELGRKILACRAEKAGEGLARIREQTGINLTEDVEQVGMMQGVVAMGGWLGGIKLPESLGSGERYGDEATIHTGPPDSRGKAVFVGRVGPSLLLMGDNVDAVKAAIDRAEGRAPSQAATADHSDVRGRLTSEELSELLTGGGSQDETIAAIAKLATGVDLRMNVEEHVALSLDLGAAGEGAAGDLSASLKSAVTIARQLARNEGMDKTAWLLDQARFHEPTADGLGLDLAVPGNFILLSMGCTPDGE